jgi:hypothetical protein
MYRNKMVKIYSKMANDIMNYSEKFVEKDSREKNLIIFRELGICVR